jgi:hypothetical protein
MRGIPHGEGPVPVARPPPDLSPGRSRTVRSSAGHERFLTRQEGPRMAARMLGLRYIATGDAYART